MKKIVSLVVLILLMVFNGYFVKATDPLPTPPIHSATVGTAYYESNSLIERNALRSGVVHEKYVSHISNTLTGFSAAGSGGGGENVSGQLYPESVNFLSIPQGSNAKIVNWAMSGPYYSSWKKGTVESLALDFEASNPGWKVIAGINADFFDISGHKPLMQAPSGSCVVNGEVYKGVFDGTPALGFTNRSSGPTLVGSQTIEFNGYRLNFYDEVGALHGSYAPGENLKLYYSYYYFPEGMTYEDNVREYYQSSIPAGSYIVTGANLKQEVCYSEYSYYGAGYCEKNNGSDVLIQPGCFGFYTTDENIISMAEQYPYVSINQLVVGAYQACDNITGCGATLVYNGEGIVYGNKERHPRTIVGVKEDGTIVFCTVDGRQPNKDMYGMTYEELSATLIAYGCVEGYNLDGGGSTTMIIRDGKKFRTLNSPSDGSARLDANALLVVVQDIDLGIEEVTDTTCKLTAPTNIPGTEINNLVVHLNDHDYALTDTVKIEGLNAHQKYTVTYEYDRTYRGLTEHVSGEPFTIQTGNQIPKITQFNIKVDEKNSTLTASFVLNDPDNVIDEVRFYYTKGSKVVKDNTITIPLGDYKLEDYSIVVFYTLDSTTKYSDVLEIKNPTITEEKEANNKKGCFNKAGMILPLIISASLLVIILKRKNN